MINTGIYNRISIYSVLLTVLVLFSAEYNNIMLSMTITILTLYGIKKPERIIPTFFLTSLSTDYFVAFSGIGFTRIFSVILLLGFVLSNRQLILRKKWLLELTLIFGATFVTFLFSTYRDVNSLLSMGLNILVFIIFTNYKFGEAEIKEILNNIFYSIVIMIIFLGVQFITNPDILTNGRLTISHEVNENRFAMMFGQLAAFSFGYMLLVKNRLYKVIILTLSIISVYFILLSGSRSAFIGILFGVTAAFTLLALKNKRQKKILFLLLAFGIVGYLSFEYIVSSNPLLSYRFNFNQVISSGGTRRWPRIVTELKYVIPNNFMFGVGLDAINEYIATSKYMSDPGSSHNFIVSMLTQVGVIGFVAYMSFYYKIIKKLIKSLSLNAIHIIPLILILTAIFNGIGEVMYSERLFWNALSLAGLILATLNMNVNKI